MKKSQKRTIITISTIAGVIILFLVVAFFPVNSDVKPNPASAKDDTITETDSEKLSKSELEKRVEELEEENKELKTQVEKYKILAEQTTKAIQVSKPVTEDDSSSKTSEDDLKDSSEYYDKDYKKYTETDDKPATKPSSNTNKNTSDKTSDTGL